MMKQQPLVLLQWEAFYPYSDLQISLEKISTSKEFPIKNLHLALPYSYLQQANSNFSDSKLNLGANSMLDAAPDTFTGSIAAKALQDIKAAFVVVGKASERHSEPEHAQTSHLKLQQALKNQIPVFFCFGESTQEAEEGRTAETILNQLKTAFENIDPQELTQVHFVYDTPSILMDRSDIQQKNRDETFEVCHQQYVSLWGEEVAASLKTFCALPAQLPISETFFKDSPFAGLYFKMVNTEVEWLFKTYPQGELSEPIEPIEPTKSTELIEKEPSDSPPAISESPPSDNPELPLSEE